MDIDLHIEELRLDGFASVHRDPMGEAVQRELERLLTEQGVSAALLFQREIGRVEGGSFERKGGASGEKIGAQVAQAVYKGINRADR